MVLYVFSSILGRVTVLHVEATILALVVLGMPARWLHWGLALQSGRGLVAFTVHLSLPLSLSLSHTHTHTHEHTHVYRAHTKQRKGTGHGAYANAPSKILGSYKRTAPY